MRCFIRQFRLLNRSIILYYCYLLSFVIEKTVRDCELRVIYCLNNVKAWNIFENLEVPVVARLLDDQKGLLILGRFTNCELTLSYKHNFGHHPTSMQNYFTRLISASEQTYHKLVDESLLQLTKEKTEPIQKAAKYLLNNLLLKLEWQVLVYSELFDDHVEVKHERVFQSRSNLSQHYWIEAGVLIRLFDLSEPVLIVTLLLVKAHLKAVVFLKDLAN